MLTWTCIGCYQGKCPNGLLWLNHGCVMALNQPAGKVAIGFRAFLSGRSLLWLWYALPELRVWVSPAGLLCIVEGPGDSVLAGWACFLTREGYLPLVVARRGKLGIFLERVLSAQALLHLGKLQRCSEPNLQARISLAETHGRKTWTVCMKETVQENPLQFCCGWPSCLVLLCFKWYLSSLIFR